MDVRELAKRTTQLGFTPQPMVAWLAPSQLLRTAVKVVLSTLFADYSDRREVQGGLPGADLVARPGPDGVLWMDYLADTGDGFDSTYTVLSVAAAADVTPQPGGPRLPRGQLLVMGGDEVYPTPSATAYEDRLKGPMRSALPESALVGAQRPVVLALPGNHDWYDGLSAFLRIFTQGRRVGGWASAQSRSYFAVRLTGAWWLAAVDTQLGSYIDEPQLRYFREHLTAHLVEGDAVIVCAPVPTWVHTGLGEPDAFNSLHFFEREVVRNRADADGVLRPTGASVRLWLSGDEHHYARFEEQVAGGTPPGVARQLVTCGLGGAYLSGTHHLPDDLVLPPPESTMADRDAPARFVRRAAWPNPATSRVLAGGILSPGPRGIVRRNPGLWQTIGIAQAVLLAVLLGVLGQEHRLDPAGVLLAGHPGWAWSLALQALGWLVAGLVVWTLARLARRRPPGRPPEAALFLLAQLAATFATLAAALAIWDAVLGARPDAATLSKAVVLGATLLAAVVVTGLVGCVELGVWTLVSGQSFVRDWAMSGQAIEDWKGLLRLRIDPGPDGGSVTVHPLGVRQVVHDWSTEPVPTDAPGVVRERVVPAAGTTQPVLVEAPFVVRARP